MTYSLDGHVYNVDMTMLSGAYPTATTPGVHTAKFDAEIGLSNLPGDESISTDGGGTLSATWAYVSQPGFPEPVLSVVGPVNYTFKNVPEPSTLALFLVGLVICVVCWGIRGCLRTTSQMVCAAATLYRVKFWFRVADLQQLRSPQPCLASNGLRYITKHAPATTSRYVPQRPPPADIRESCPGFEPAILYRTRSNLHRRTNQRLGGVTQSADASSRIFLAAGSEWGHTRIDVPWPCADRRLGSGWIARECASNSELHTQREVCVRFLRRPDIR